MSPQEKKGYYGWTIVFCSFIVIFLSFSIRGSFGVFMPQMQKALGWSATALSGGISIFMVVYGIFAMISGMELDKFGPKPTFLIHGILLGLGLFLASYSTKPWHFYLTYGVISGIGAGALFAPPTQLVRKWFIKDLGKALGFTTAGCGLGFGLAPLLAMVMMGPLGWDWSFSMKVLGILLTVGVVIVAFFTKPTPESIGLHPPGYEEAQAADKSGGTSAKAEYSFTLGESLKTSSWWLLAIAWFCSNLSEFCCLTHSLNYAKKDLVLNPNIQTYLYALSGFAYMIIGPITGGFIDRLTVKFAGDQLKARKRCTLIFYGLAAVACAIMLAGEFMPHGTLTEAGEVATAAPFATHAVYTLYSLIFGIASGSYIPSIVGISGVIYGRKYAGSVWGTLTLIGMGAGAGLGPIMAGALYDIRGSYLIPIIVALVSYAAAALLTQTLHRHNPPADAVARGA
ncbi:MAG: MFS transporter [Actinomycetes bacterium]|jgi:MFS family permease|nr:MFS transporter [Actinomycetes bacterium]